MNTTEKEHIKPLEVPPYSQLASIYDEVMSYIDYKSWVGYLKKLSKLHGIAPKKTLDISCGTGNIIPYMKRWSGQLYCTDVSVPMLRELLRKMPEYRNRTWASEMSALPLRMTFDLILNLQDSVNYYLAPENIANHFEHVYHYLNSDGVYIYDFSTEANIRNNFADLREVYEDDEYGYERVNHYNPRTHLNTTEFLIWKLKHTKRVYYRETHKQRMYTMNEFKELMDASPFDRWDWYEEETTNSPREDAERVHVVMRKT